MRSAEIERRVAPRFAVRCTGELASGIAVTDVTISDMSVTGCGIELHEPDADVLGRTGVLSIRTAEASAPVMLPVVVSNSRLDGGRARLGLQFRRLSMGQMRGLIGVMDGVIQK